MRYRYGISNINLLFLYGCWIRTSALMWNVSTPYERTLYDICVGSRTLSGAFAKRFSCLLVLCCARLPAPHSLMPQQPLCYSRWPWTGLRRALLPPALTHLRLSDCLLSLLALLWREPKGLCMPGECSTTELQIHLQQSSLHQYFSWLFSLIYSSRWLWDSRMLLWFSQKGVPLGD